jgi:hypothetical protein
VSYYPFFTPFVAATWELEEKLRGFVPKISPLKENRKIIPQN